MVKYQFGYVLQVFVKRKLNMILNILKSLDLTYEVPDIW